MKHITVAAMFVAFSTSFVFAGSNIERACLKSDRNGATRALCGCIQDVADLTLDRGDQRLAAKLFKDPGKAQEIRQSDRKKHEVFWKRYKNFGDTAEVYCAS